MALSRKRNRPQMHYSVGYHMNENLYILQIVIHSVARYYQISREEYDMFDTNVDRLDKLAVTCHRAGRNSQRFLCSTKQDENTIAQLKLLQDIMDA